MTKAYKGSIHQLVVNLRCEWCKGLFPWKPLWKDDIEKRIPRTCSSRCRSGLKNWEKDRKTGETIKNAA